MTRLLLAALDELPSLLFSLALVGGLAGLFLNF